jgi:hypothetical protein
MPSFGETIRDRSTAERFIEWCVREIGLGFHPDTPFADYVTIASGTAVFSSDEAVRLDTLLDRAFEFCDPYEIGRLAQRRAMGLEGEPDSGTL